MQSVTQNVDSVANVISLDKCILQKLSDKNINAEKWKIVSLIIHVL